MKHTLAGNMHFGKKGSVFGEVADCGAASFMGICRLDSLPHRRIDVKVYAPQHYACALLYFTGSDHFNRSMRWARRRTAAGNTSTTRSRSAGPVEFEREEDVFAFLELPYKTPPERALDDNAAGIAAAAARVRAENNVDVDDDDDAGAEVFVGQRPQLSLWSGAK
ncbi:DNA-directed DNA polymerase [Aureococcus anophagefferens]|nr:DNA-directed DNA polymerase [Aureococcus anophagefferens]